MSAGRAIAIAAAIAAAGCIEPNPDYCSATIHCADSSLVCDMVLNRCVPPGNLGTGSDGGLDLAGCTTSDTCGNPTPICTRPKCGPCTSDAQCKSDHAATPRCATGTGSCVECLGKDDCAAAGKTCDPMKNLCVPCSVNADCTSGACLKGVCLDATKVVYVNNQASCPGLGTSASPACTITIGVMIAKTKLPLAVAIAGSPNPYGESVDLTGLSVTLIGPGLAASPSAQVRGGSLPALLAGIGTNATVDGLDLGATSSDGIDCLSTGNTSLTLTRSSVHDAVKVGLSSTNCALTLDSVQFDLNPKGGISIASGSYAITNCTVQHASAGPGVSLGSATGTFQHNTIANNLPAGLLGGVACGGGQKVEASIIWNNQKLAGSQVQGCMVTGSALDEMIGTGNLVGMPDLTADGHLAANNANNMACCIDQLMMALVDHDRDGRPRPQPQPSGKADIGAHEWPQ